MTYNSFRPRSYYWQFSDGKSAWMTKDEALAYRKKHQVTSEDPIADPTDEKRSRPLRIRDGFKEGYHPFFKTYVKSVGHFKELCKIFNVNIAEKMHTEDDFKQEIPLFTEDNARYVKSLKGNEVSDVAINRLLEGKTLDNTAIEVKS